MYLLNKRMYHTSLPTFCFIVTVTKSFMKTFRLPKNIENYNSFINYNQSIIIVNTIFVLSFIDKGTFKGILGYKRIWF